MLNNQDSNLRLTLLRIVLLVVIAGFGVARSASAVDLTFTCNTPGCLFASTDTLLVSVHIDAGTPDLRGASLSILYDSAAITPVAVEPGPLWDASACMPFLAWLNPGSPDSIRADLGGLGCSLTGPGSILVIKFVCASPTPGLLGFGTNYLRDVTNTALSYTWTPIAVQCEIPTAAQVSSWSMIKSMYTQETDPGK